MRVRRLLLAVVAAGAGVLVWSDVVHWRASRRGLAISGGHEDANRTQAVVVLGFANRGDRANRINRYRVRAALRSLDPAARSMLILCGGSVAGAVPEAELLERYAVERGYTGPVLLDRESRSTWENVEHAIPLVQDAGSIVIVSNSLHAEKARAYLAMQRPDLARRLRRAREHRFGEILWVKPIAAVIGLRALRRLRRHPPIEASAST